ncbi:MAG: FAD/NAD(P)-binding oxidoreductase [Aestuariivita sp.]|nr:FAD/NAD(P)-binding oxidoreductase [Aestuariivita sp.]
MYHIVVIGAGQAGASLVAELRSQGFAGKISMVGDEPMPPYQRPPLSKGYLLGEITLERLFLRPERYYVEKNIDLRLGARVSRIDRENKTVHIEQDVVPYDQLVLTTGSSPRKIPSQIGGNLKNVFVVRSLADVDLMSPFFEPKRKVLIVGGGYIGLEAAAVAAKLGVQVILIEQSERILQRVAAKETSDYFRNLHRHYGVDIRESVGLERLKGDQTVSEVELTDGSYLSVDFVIIGIGILPNTSLAESAGLVIDNGIAVDEFGRTSDISIWAAGDCCSFSYRGMRLRLESVPNAIDQASCVARNLLGEEEKYQPRPWFWSDQYDVKLQIAGLNKGYDRIITRAGTGATTSFWYFCGDKLLAVDAMNDPRSYMIGKRLIEAGACPDATLIGDPTADLKKILKS